MSERAAIAPEQRTLRAPGYRDGARVALPLAAVVGVFGVSWGVLARDAGMSVVAAVAMSLTTFGGSAQFAAVAILAEGGTLGAAIVAAVLLNARYGPIGVSVAPALRGNLFTRFLHSQMVVDESWAVANRGGHVDRQLLLGAGLAIYVFWIIGTLAGALGGEWLGDPEQLGFDAAFPALFLALLAPQVRRRRPGTAAVLGGAIALVLIPFTRPGVPIIAASIACLPGLFRK